VYHTPGPGDPTFIRQPGDRTAGRQIFSATAGRHAHFQTWSPDAGFIYFVQGTVPDMLDIWRVRPTGAEAERITQHNAQVSHPVLLNARTLMYLATESDGSGPWLHTLDVERRVPHRIGIGLDRYTSLSASADGRRVVATIANAKGTLWRIPIGDAPIDASVATPISLTTGRGFSPRLGPGYLLYVASKGRSDTIWKLADGAAAMELWSAPDARIVGGPEVSPDGRQAAFSIEQQGRTLLYVMNVDGTNAHVVNESHEWRGAPAWSADGGWLTSAATVNGAPHLFRVSVAGAVTGMLDEYATDPVWSPRGDFLVYSGADVGTRFPVKAVTASAAPHAIPAITLTRGARRLRFLSGRDVLVMLTGDLQHKDLSAIDLDTGTVRQLTKLPPDFTVRDFDISPDGREAVLERVQEQSEVVLIDLAR
jgi:dipeptidyl aminopeptidase/acylaminoacyl peptidase